MPTDLIAVIGGDGTVLKVVPQAIEKDLPIWPINAGILGFLTEDAGDLAVKLSRLACGDYRLDRRDTLAVTYLGATRYALNDVCIMRLTDRLQTVTVHLDYRGERISYRGDGAVVSTPSGSTGYSLSSGGPIIAPDVRAIMFAPICAHSMRLRHMVFAPDATLQIGCEGSGVLFVDGIEWAQGEPTVTVRMSDRMVTFLRFDNEGYFAKIDAKL